MIKFMQENYLWLIPLLVAVISGIIAGVFKLLQKNGKIHKQKIGNIYNSQVHNINGDVDEKD
ncbi:MAG: hypothetical protein ABFC90_02005 [Bacteroidales bacterium]|nr:hypothetical protein [Bacteroidales bacterium]